LTEKQKKKTANVIGLYHNFALYEFGRT